MSALRKYVYIDVIFKGSKMKILADFFFKNIFLVFLKI